jgi:iron complex transport system substrate-binding protein
MLKLHAIEDGSKRKGSRRRKTSSWVDPIRTPFTIFLILFLTATNSPVACGVEVLDDLGRRVSLPSPAKRIIALYGAYNEILAALGLEDRIVGRTKADRIPPVILSKPVIGTHMRPNIEIVLGIRPDLALQLAGRQEALDAVQQLRREGLPVAVFNPSSFRDLFSVIARIGVLTGEPERARRLIAALQLRLDRVRGSFKVSENRPSVFFEVRYPNLLGAGRASIVNDIISHAGGRNVIDIRKKLVRMNMEALIGLNPDVYLVQRGPMNQHPSPPSTRPHFQILRAVKQGRILIVDEQVYSRPGPRCVDAVEELATFLRSETFYEPSASSSSDKAQ